MNNVTSYQQQPKGLTQKQITAKFNSDQAQALAMGDPRYQMKELDRGGLSRGGAQMNQAGINASQAVADGIAAAYSNQLQNQQYNANLGLQNQATSEQYGQALGALQSQANYANQMAALQRQGALYGLIGNLIR
jgi:hypothetical protein